MRDFLGYERNARSDGQVASSEFAIVSIGGRQSLVQNIGIQYGQTIETVTQVGDPNLYWMPGRAQGSVNCTKLVGANGFLSGWRGTECGKITPMSVSVAGGKCGFSGNGNLTFDGGIIESVNINLSSSTLQISESVNIRVASLSAS